jgi:hypothetical protein
MDIRFVEQTLFGEMDASPVSQGEFYAAHHLVSDWEEVRIRSEWCMDHLEYTGDLLLEVEDSKLLADCMRGYIFGLYSATIITSDAFIERLLTDFLESRGMSSESRGSLGKRLSALEKHSLIDENVLRRISRLHRIRNSLAHEKGPEDPFRLFRRAIAEGNSPEQILRTDAGEAVSLAYGIAARVKRNFPRVHENLSE